VKWPRHGNSWRSCDTGHSELALQRAQDTGVTGRSVSGSGAPCWGSML
jgi:hypothetical protein